MNTDDNPFGKLDEAQRVYLNPTMELIIQKADLSKHCYYRLNKYPSHQDMSFWDQITELAVQMNDEKLQTLITQIETNQINYVEKDKLLANLKLALIKKDITYVQFVANARPKTRKLTMNLMRKRTIIDTELAKKIDITPEELAHLTTYRLKMAMNQYIAKKNLQRETDVKIDETIRDLLFDNDEHINKYLHYFQILKGFNKKYLQRSNATGESSESS